MNTRYHTLLTGLVCAGAFGTATDAFAYEHYTCDGKLLKWSDEPVTFRASSGFSSGGWKTAMQAAIDRWGENPSNQWFVVEYDDTNVALQNGQNEVWWSNITPPAVASLRWNSNSCRMVEVDVRVDTSVNYTAWMSAASLIDYGGSQRPVRNVLLHEMGHGIPLRHENEVYAIMGEDWTHMHVNGGSARAYAGEDAVDGAVDLYGVWQSNPQDLSVTHWAYSGADGEYSTHRRTVVYDQNGNPLTSTLDGDEPVYDVIPGGTVRAEFTWENNGSSTQQVDAGLYLSTNSTISTLDQKLRSMGMTLGRNKVWTTTHSVTIPADAPGGRAWLGAIVDDTNEVPEFVEVNNATFVSINIVRFQPKLPILKKPIQRR